MKTSKRLLAIMTVICISFFALCFPAYADIEIVASGTCGADGDTITWTLDSEGVLTISGEGEMQDFAPYTTENPLWFSQRDNILCIRISEGVASIGDEAFRDCSSVTSITIPDSVTSIGDYAFDGCRSLTSITIPDSVASIGIGVFSDCYSLMEINVDENNSVYSDYEGVLYNDDLSTVIRCPSGKSGEITIADGASFIEKGAFGDCISLTSITIPGSVTSIGDYAFTGCSSLTGITIPDSVTSIGGGAFNGCNSLTIIAIPEGVTSIGDYTFCGCDSLTNIAIPDGVTSIGGGAFNGCSSLTIIAIPEGVTSIGDYTFCGCDSLTNIAIPDGVTDIGRHAFDGCRSLTSIIIPDSVTSIGYEAFSGCSSLTSITIPDSVSSIGICVFYSCHSLMEINVDENNSVYSDYEGVLYNDDLTTVICCPPGKRGEMTIVDGTTTIGDYAFSSCSSLTGITIPDSVTSIGGGAFYYCSSLTNIAIPEGVTSIEDNAFTGCSSLASITIPGSVTSIGGGAFSGCRSLTSITIPGSVTSIGDDAFNGCSSLTIIAIPEGVTSIGDYTFCGCDSLTNIAIPDGVTDIGRHAFHGCSSLTSITIPDSVTSIGDHAFCICSSLTSIIIPDSVTSIGYETFFGCSSLTSITIPDSVTSIGDYAFYYSSNLKTIVFPKNLEYINCTAIAGCDQLSAIYVVKDSLADNVFKEQYGEIINYYDFYSDGHCYSETIITEPTCTESGERICTCVICGYSFYELIPAGHKWGEWQLTTPPTCVDNGIETRICENDPTHVETRSVDATGHEWDEGVVTTEPTYYSTGVMTYTCTVCGAQYDEIIPQLVYGGTCGANGDNLTWTLDNEGVLTISGEGEMLDYVVPDNPPWFSKRDNILCIRISEGVTSIGERAFFGCDTTTIEISNSVASIGSGAFSYCSSLASITIPDSVTSIGDYPFWSCSSLTDIYVDQNNETYSDHDGILYKDDTTTIICCPSGKSGEVTIVDGTTAIGDEAFMGCINLTCVTIPESVTTIGSSAFCYCYGLTSITIPDSVTSLGDNVFHACRGLTGITIPKNVVNIGERAFDYCWNLVNIYVDENNSIYSDYEGVLYKDALTTVIRCPSGKSGEIAIADGAAFIGEGAFDYCNSLTSITIPDSVTSIGDWAFRGCSSLKSITIPDSVTSIGEYAFSECSSLKYIFFGGSPIMWNNLLNRPADGVVHYYATGHTLGDGEIMTGPTCTTEGVGCKHCIVDNCDYSMTESIPALGHAWGGWAVTTAPGCETDGEETRVCANDNSHVETRVIPSIGHDWDEGTVIKEPTYSDEGLILYTCKNDPNHTYTEVLPKLDRPDESIILRIAGSNRSATAIEAAKQLKARKGIEKFDNIVIASGTGFADALSASYLAYKKDGPILLVDKSSITTITDFVNENLATGGKVFIVGGEGAVSMEVDANIIAGSGNNSVVRLAGKDRYLTNIMVLNEAGVAGEDLLVASGTGFADALSASAAKKPIFLVGKSLSDSQKTYLNSHKSSLSGKYYVIGGTGAVTQDVEDALTGYGTVQRLQGSDRYATSITVADEFFPGNVDTVVVAFGTNFPDGLSGGPIAAAYDAPLILVTDKNYAHAVKQFAEKNAFQLVVMGGTGVISDDTAQKIAYNLQ